MSYTKEQWRLATDNSPFIYALNDEGSNRFWTMLAPGWIKGKERISDRELLANARLMTVAPELLESLEECVEYVTMVANTLSNTNVPIAAATENKARAAIAKAKA